MEIRYIRIVDAGISPTFACLMIGNLYSLIIASQDSTHRALRIQGTERLTAGGKGI
jgi:hypothetical protein